jgi:regulator of sirC expression with transglutaminase-like and TPR domain
VAYDLYREFRQAIDPPEDKIDLGRAALTIALIDSPHLDIEAYLGRIDQLAAEVSRHCDARDDLYHALAALNHVLFDRHGFRGNIDDYYDPKNSFLNEVLERKIGIPITLSVLYMEVARRIGIDIQGVGLPGRFIVKCSEEGEPIFIDPFDRGEIKLPEDLSRIIERIYQRKIPLRPEFLEPTSKRQIVKRMLANLKAIYLKNDRLVEALSILDHLIIADPAGAEDIRDRGAVYLRLECFAQARDDFETYLRLAPSARDATEVREQIGNLSKRLRLIH